MLRKLVMSPTPLVVVVTFAVIPAGAQAAAPFWEQCTEVGTGGEFFESECLTKGKPNNWSWVKIPQGKANGEQVKTHGRLTFIDETFISGQKIEMECAVNDEELIWNATDQKGEDRGYNQVKAFKIEQCRINVPSCVVTFTAEGLPWPTELVEVGGVVRVKITGIQLQFKLTSCALAATLTYTGSLEPKIINGSPGFLEFDSSAGELKAGGNSKGKFKGDDFVERRQGGGLRVS
jgi:hypothetical protein